MTFRGNIELIIAALEGLGYSLSSDFFDFDSAPSSKMEKLFRLESGTSEIIEISGNRVEKKKRVDVWAAFKITAKGDRKESILEAMDCQEAIEDELMVCLPEIPGIVFDSMMAKYIQNYLIIRIGFGFTYWRDLS
jgi:hypothetical protein